MAQGIQGRVISVTDGDTLTVQDTANTSSVIRLAEIDAPEKCQPYGNASRTSLVGLALNKSVAVTIVDRDKYGRVVGKVTVPGQSETVNKAQLRRGMAWVYDAYVQDPSLDAIEGAAQSLLLGLWADSSPIAPWNWRQGNYGCSRDSETGPSMASSILPKIMEYHNSVTNHYFMTASADEANGIDAGAAGGGWSRTGNTFSVWPIESTEPGTVPVCRFYAYGANSHFFTANAAECDWLKQLEGEQRRQATAEGKQFLGWMYEGTRFKVKMPPEGAACPAGTEEIYRAYNNRHAQNDPNHRFSPWMDDINELKGNGWVPEGVAMCAPK